MITTRNHDHIKHRELYYNGAQTVGTAYGKITRGAVLVARGWQILSAGPSGVLLLHGSNNELRTRIPWRQVIQFTYWHDDDIRKDVPDLV